MSKRKLVDFFSTTEIFDRWLLSLKPGTHTRISNTGRLVTQKYTHRKIQLGSGKFVIRRRK